VSSLAPCDWSGNSIASRELQRSGRVHSSAMKACPCSSGGSRRARRRIGAPWALIAAGALGLAGCNLFSSRYLPASPPGQEARLDAFLADRFQTWLDLNPVEATLNGLRRDLDRWGESSPEAHERKRALGLADAQRLLDDFPARDFSGPALRRREHYSRMLGAYQLGQDARRVLAGLALGEQCATEIGGTLMRFQVTATPAGMDACLRRLDRATQRIDGLRMQLLLTEKSGETLSTTAITRALAIGRWLLGGAPFQGEASSPLLSNIEERIAQLDVEETRARAWAERAADTLEESLGPALGRLLATLEKLQTDSHDEGLWRRSGGAEAYSHLVTVGTGKPRILEAAHEEALIATGILRRELAKLGRELELSPPEAGEDEVIDAIRSERWIQAGEPANGNADSADSEQAGEAGLALERTLDRLRRLHADLPSEAELRIDAVSTACEFRVGNLLQAPGTSLISLIRAPLDGALAALIEVDTTHAAELPAWRLRGLVCSSSVPGRLWFEHHARSRSELPQYRRVAAPAALANGWSYYALDLLAETTGPEARERRLTASAGELWGAALAAADSGIHLARWSRERALGYLRESCPLTERELQRGLDSILLQPGRAVVARAGLMTIRNLRREARAALGPMLSLTNFHAAVVAEGDLPLDLLTESVREWVLVERQ
jgi:uncharacterized protein (DUF885 family)